MKKQTTIKSLLQRISWLMLVLSIVPLIISVLIYTRYLFTYERSVGNISEANRIANDVEEKIIEEAWSLTYGQLTPEEFTKSNNVHRIKKEIRQIKKNTQSTQERATLNIVTRSLDNVNNYLEKIVANIEVNEPFQENQELMIHVESATNLVHDILQDFVNVEIELAANQSQQVRQSIIVLSVIEAFIIAAIIFFTRSTNTRLMKQIQQPMEEMIHMADALSDGKLNYRINTLPGNELQKLSNSMNEMADNLVVLIDQITTQTLHLLIDELIEKAEKSENTLLHRLVLLNELNQLVEEKNKKVKTKFPIATPSNLSAIISDNTLFRNYLNQVLDFLKRTVIDESMRQYRDLIEQAILYIKQNFSDPELTLGAVASHTNLSSSHFSTVFSQSVGKTFVEYLTEQRLNEAKLLLKETDWKLSSIASEIGYNDPNYFSYIFKRKEGVSPKEYRKTRSLL